MTEKNKINILRTALCALLLCALVLGMLVFCLWAKDAATEKFEQIDTQNTQPMKNMSWLVEKVLYILPVCVLLICQTVIYKFVRKNREVAYRERSWELTVAFIFTYVILLPAVVIYSKNNPPVPDAETGEVALSLIARTVQWFMWQILIFMPAILYSRVMAKECIDECPDDEYTAEGEEAEIES